MPIHWVLKDINEANSILALLGKMPYDQVADLIERLKAQQQAQLNPPRDPKEPMPLPDPSV